MVEGESRDKKIRGTPASDGTLSHWHGTPLGKTVVSLPCLDGSSAFFLGSAMKNHRVSLKSSVFQDVLGSPARRFF